MRPTVKEGHNRTQPRFAKMAALIKMVRELPGDRAEVQRETGQQTCFSAGGRIPNLENVLTRIVSATSPPRLMLRKLF
jgi:hypothetical protein